MSPVVQSRGKKITAADNLYTVILAVAVCVVLATAVFVAYQCYTQYDTIFTIQ
jgi:hypothetical protein